MSGYIDKTHAKNHKKECQDTYSAYKEDSLDGVDSQACEQYFAWFSGFKHITKHMNQIRFKFFVLIMLWQRNVQNEKRLKNSKLFN